VTSCALATPARAQTVIRMATVVPEGTAWWREIRNFQNVVEKETGGQVRLKIYFGGIAGDELEVGERIRREQLDGAVPIAMDETARDPGAVGSGACDFVCLKIAACGGITGLWDAARSARAAGSRVYVASTYDGPVGIAAGLQAAAALGELPSCGLATLALFADVENPFPVREGRIAMPSTPGLGIT